MRSPSHADASEMLATFSSGLGIHGLALMVKPSALGPGSQWESVLVGVLPLVLASLAGRHAQNSVCRPGPWEGNCLEAKSAVV